MKKNIVMSAVVAAVKAVINRGLKSVMVHDDKRYDFDIDSAIRRVDVNALLGTNDGIEWNIQPLFNGKTVGFALNKCVEEEDGLWWSAGKTYLYYFDNEVMKMIDDAIEHAELEEEMIEKGIIYSSEDYGRGPEYDQSEELAFVTDDFVVTVWSCGVLDPILKIYDKNLNLVAEQNRYPEKLWFMKRNKWQSVVL